MSVEPTGDQMWSVSPSESLACLSKIFTSPPFKAIDPVVKGGGTRGVATMSCDCLLSWLRPSSIVRVMNIPKIVNSKIRENVKQLQPLLSRRTVDLADRKRELHLDHLEEGFLCCVCLQPGTKVEGVKKRDGGLHVVNKVDIDLFTAIFGFAVRGYLCDVCMRVAEMLKGQSRHRTVARQIEVRNATSKASGGADRRHREKISVLLAALSSSASSGGAADVAASPVVVLGDAGAAANALVDSTKDAEPAALTTSSAAPPAATVVLSPWATDVLESAVCEMCHTLPVSQYHSRYQVFLCVKCVQRRRHPEDSIALFPSALSQREGSDATGSRTAATLTFSTKVLIEMLLSPHCYEDVPTPPPGSASSLARARRRRKCLPADGIDLTGGAATIHGATRSSSRAVRPRVVPSSPRQPHPLRGALYLGGERPSLYRQGRELFRRVRHLTAADAAPRHGDSGGASNGCDSDEEDLFAAQNIPSSSAAVTAPVFSEALFEMPEDPVATSQTAAGSAAATTAAMRQLQRRTNLTLFDGRDVTWSARQATPARAAVDSDVTNAVPPPLSLFSEAWGAADDIPPPVFDS